MSDPKRVVLGVVVLVVALLLFERWHLSDEERVEAAWDDLCAAMADEAPAQMRARLHEDMTYSGPRPVGEGDQAEAMVALAGYWDQVDRVAVITRKNEIKVQGHVATNLATTVVRFHWGDSPVIYRVRVQVAWAADGDSWRARDIDILEMTPGLFGG
jgi:hypothetical protein